VTKDFNHYFFATGDIEKFVLLKICSNSSSLKQLVTEAMLSSYQCC
jgi:hypothetical protein